MKHYIIAGATGLIGSHLSKQLTRTDRSITLLARRPIDAVAPHHKVNTDFFDSFTLPSSTDISDVVICALGTTIKKAGSQAAFREVDYELVVKLATAAKKAGYRKFIVVSSIGAGEGSRGFYLKTKTDMEKNLQSIGFDSLVIIRPSLLLGSRNESRALEQFTSLIAKLFSPLFIGKLKKYQPIAAEQVAAAIIHFSETATRKLEIIESDLLRQHTIQH